MSASVMPKTSIIQRKKEMRRKETALKEILISEVQKRPVLWDKRLAPEYRERRLVDAMWEEVVKKMPDQLESKEVCKKMWKNLYDHFRNVYTAAITTKSGSAVADAEAAMKTVKWALFQRLMFLRDVIERRQGVSNAPAESPENVASPENARSPEINEIGRNDESPPEFEIKAQPYEETEHKAFSTEYLDIGFSQPSTSACDTPPTPAQRPQRLKRGMKRTFSQAPIYNHLNNLSKELRKPDDDASLFGKYLAVVVRRVPEALRQKCEATLLDVANVFADSRIPLIVIPDNENIAG